MVPLFFLLLSPDASHQPLISPAEVAVLESMMEGGRQLNLKAHFLTQLPDLCPLIATLTYLNVSFNDLRVSRFIGWLLNVWPTCTVYSLSSLVPTAIASGQTGKKGYEYLNVRCTPYACTKSA